MSRVQTRRTVSMSRGTKTRLSAYAESYDVPESALVEYLVEAQLERPLDREAYAKYRVQAADRVWRAQAAAGRQTAGRQTTPRLFGRRCGRCRQLGHTVYTCQEVRS